MMDEEPSQSMPMQSLDMGGSSGSTTHNSSMDTRGRTGQPSTSSSSAALGLLEGGAATERVSLLRQHKRQQQQQQTHQQQQTQRPVVNGAGPSHSSSPHHTNNNNNININSNNTNIGSSSTNNSSSVAGGLHMAAASPSSLGARTRMAELFSYWSCLPATQRFVRELVRDHMSASATVNGQEVNSQQQLLLQKHSKSVVTSPHLAAQAAAATTSSQEQDDDDVLGLLRTPGKKGANATPQALVIIDPTIDPKTPSRPAQGNTLSSGQSAQAVITTPEHQKLQQQQQQHEPPSTVVVGGMAEEDEEEEDSASAPMMPASLLSDGDNGSPSPAKQAASSSSSGTRTRSGGASSDEPAIRILGVAAGDWEARHDAERASTTSPQSQPSPPHSGTPGSHRAHPQQRTTPHASKSPRDFNLVTAPHVNHLVDELDAAHRKGALSPRSPGHGSLSLLDASPPGSNGQAQPQAAPAGGGQATSAQTSEPQRNAAVPMLSPLDAGLLAMHPSNQSAMHPSQRTSSPLSLIEGLGGTTAASTTQRSRSGRSSSLDSRCSHSRSPSPSNSEGHGSISRSDSFHTSSGQKQPHIGRRNSKSELPGTPSISGSNSNAAQPRSPPPEFDDEESRINSARREAQDKKRNVPVASYSDIPQFYFPKGSPMVMHSGNVLAQVQRAPPAQLQLQHPLSAQQQLLQLEGEGGAGGMMDAARTVVLPQLVALPDEEVPTLIQKLFSSVPAPPKNTGGSGSQGGTGSNRRHQNNPKRPSTSYSNQLAQYQHQLTLAMHRVCLQGFGLPGVFSRVISHRIMQQQQQQQRPTTPSTTPSSANASSAAAVSFNGQQVRSYFDQHLANKSIVRRMFNVLRQDPARPYLLRSDFEPFIDKLLEAHPGLAFLRSAAEFQQKYIETVICRIYFDLDPMDRGKISWPEFERSALPETLRHLDATEDINQVLHYFSYEHFYVLYCRFWELDVDKDGLVSPQDLERYSVEGVMNPRIIERVFQGKGRRLTSKVPNRMNYEDFIYFCICEEDKTSRRSITYWFRILDVDGDGVLAGYELETFYDFTRTKMLQITTEAISFDDVMCQIYDMLPFDTSAGIRLRDLLARPQSAFVAFNMIISVVKFLQFEQRDPFVAHQARLAGGAEKTEWDRFARMEYDRMAAEGDEDC